LVVGIIVLNTLSDVGKKKAHLWTTLNLLLSTSQFHFASPKKAIHTLIMQCMLFHYQIPCKFLSLPISGGIDPVN
jgi:hypothetical protein